MLVTVAYFVVAESSV